MIDLFFTAGAFTDAGIMLLFLVIMFLFCAVVMGGGILLYPLYKLTGGKKSFRRFLRWYADRV